MALQNKPSGKDVVMVSAADSVVVSVCAMVVFMLWAGIVRDLVLRQVDRRAGSLRHGLNRGADDFNRRARVNVLE